MAAPARKSRLRSEPTIPVQRLETVGEVEVGGGDDPLAVACFRIVDERVGSGEPGEYRFTVHGVDFTVTAEPA